MLIYFIIPFIIYFFYFLSTYLSTSKYTTLFFHTIIFFLLTVLAGFRGRGVSRDYENYLESIDIIKAGGDIIEFSEPGFKIITNFSSFFSESYILVFIIYALLGVFFKYLAILKISGLRFSYLAILIYYSNFYLFHEMTQIRIGVASGLFLLAIPDIINRNFLRFIALILAASFFHLSILVTIPLYFLKSDSINPKFWIYLMIFNLLFYLSGLSVLDLFDQYLSGFFGMKVDAYKSFMEEATSNTNISLLNRFLVYLILNFYLLYNWKILSKKSIYFIFLLKVSFISLSVAFFFYDFYLFAFRFSEIFGVVQICLFPMLALLFHEKYLSSSLVLILSLFLLFVNVTLTGLLKPYNFTTF